MTPQARKALLAIFGDSPGEICQDCGGYHLRSCPRVKRVSWVGSGATAGQRTEVEYWPSWDDSEVIYPEDLITEEDS